MALKRTVRIVDAEDFALREDQILDLSNKIEKAAAIREPYTVNRTAADQFPADQPPLVTRPPLPTIQTGAPCTNQFIPTGSQQTGSQQTNTAVEKNFLDRFFDWLNKVLNKIFKV